MFNHVSEPQGNQKPQRLDLMREKCEELGVAERIKGGIFEKVCRELLKERNSENSIKDIFLWDEWSHKDGQDTGIDLVVEHNDGTFAAVQCKFYEKNVSLNDVTNFTSKLQSGVRDIRFSKGFLITSSDFSENVYKHVEQIRKTLPVDVINEEDLKKSDIDWKASDFTKNELKLRPKKELKPHQREALERTKEYFEPVERTRGKIIMACGTGKTLTALRIIETLCPKEGKVCFFAPSIALVAQTFREFLKERKEDFIACILCSDHTVGKDDDDLSIAYLPSTPSTNPEAIVKAFEKAKKDKKRLIIFSTYQSSPVLSRAFKENHLQEEFGAFDLMICDEGHRTVGAHTQEKEKSSFLYCHDDTLIPCQKRIYMSATPKVWTSVSKAKAKQNNIEMYSMDDPQIYGDVIYSLPFSKAIEQDLLSDYQVMIVALRSDQLGDLTEKVCVQITSQDKRDKHVDRDFVCKILGTYKGLARSDLYILNEENHGKNHQANGKNSDEDIPLKPIEHYTPAQRAVLFCRDIKTSKALTKHFGTVIEAYHEEISKEVPNEHNEHNEQRGQKEEKEVEETNKNITFPLTIDHIDGGMNAKERLEKLKKLDQPQEDTCHILSNARCLSEGVDVPALDSVIFFNPKQSQNDIIQAIGRVLRKAPGKKRGFIILPLVIDQHELAHLDEAIENTDFKGIWTVLCALRSQDDSLIDETQWKEKIKIAISDPTNKQERDPKDQAQQGDFFHLLQSKTLKTLNDSLFNAMPSRFGVELYWKTFGEKTAKITETLIDRIEGIFQRETSLKESYVQALKSAIHPNITEKEAVELLSSHIVTEPIFKRLFPEGEKDPITKALNKVLEALKNNHLDNETRNLKPLYESVEEQVKNAHSENSKQQVIKNLYGTFFKQAFKKQTERFGIVYTPIEAVNFILRMVRDLTQKHFGKNLNDQGVKIYDPFTGTGSFITQLLNKENHFIDDAYVKRKVEEEIFAQDITLLSYYIAGVNIATIAKNRNPACQAFQNLILGDSLNSLERQKARENTKHPTLFDTLGKEIFEALEPNKQKEEQLDKEHINIIIGNPPYSGIARSENDNNANLPHPELEKQIYETYGKESVAVKSKATQDTLIQAIRMATNKIEQNGGIIGFILNGGFLDASSADGFRKCVVKDFSNIYVINLRGNQRTSGETSRKEGGKIFDSGSRATVAICFFVRNPAYQGAAKIHYYAVEDYLTRENKLDRLTSFQTLEDIPFTNITPNNKGDWLNHRESDFADLIPLKSNDKENALFIVDSLGLLTGRDAWVYNFSRAQLQKSMETCIQTYRLDLQAFDKKAFEARTQNIPNANKYKALTTYKDITTDSTKISWTRSLKQKLIKQENIPDFRADSIRTAFYRPFVKTNVYWEKTWHEAQSQLPKIFPKAESENRVILTSLMTNRAFCVLMTDTIPDYQTLPNTQVFPLYAYRDDRREDNINPYFVKRFQNVLGDHTIGSEDIFYYCYAVFHHKTYTETYANDLAKEAPRLPILKEFQTLAALGRALGDLHCRYEDQEPWSSVTIKEENYRVEKIRRSKENGSVMIYNPYITINDIPPKAYDYTMNGKSAIDGFIERYQNTMDKDTLIPNDPNAFRGEKYLFDTLCKLITVSLKSVDLIEKINALPYDRVEGG